MKSPNHGGKFSKSDPRLIIIHYTAGTTLAGAVSWLCNRDARASAHLVIDTDGKVEQLVDFDTIAWHAGRSEYSTPGRIYKGLNKHSIGIELVNPGPLDVDQESGKAITSFSKEYKGARIEFEGDTWAAYPEVQLESALQFCLTLRKICPKIAKVLGHSDIAPGRKIDPGPAFPMRAFQAAFEGRE